MRRLHLAAEVTLGFLLVFGCTVGIPLHDLPSWRAVVWELGLRLQIPSANIACLRRKVPTCPFDKRFSPSKFAAVDPYQNQWASALNLGLNP